MQTNQKRVNTGRLTIMHHRNSHKFPEWWNKFDWGWTSITSWFPVGAFIGFAKEIYLKMSRCLLDAFYTFLTFEAQFYSFLLCFPMEILFLYKLFMNFFMCVLYNVDIQHK